MARGTLSIASAVAALAVLAATCARVPLAAAHSTKYPHVAPGTPLHGLRRARWETDGTPPPILSWHIHVTYFLTNPAQVAAALAFRAKAAAYFAPFLGPEPECDGRYDFGFLCIINDHDFENTTLAGGPFPVGEWSIFVPVPHYALVVPWMLQHRCPGNQECAFSIVVHPNTGFEYEDHSVWAVWSGQPQPLDMTIFQQGNQTNEFGHWRGDAENPTCMPPKTVCGDMDPAYNATTSTLCCPGLSCMCDSSADQLCRCA